MSTRRAHLVRADELQTGDIINLRGTHYHTFGLRYHIVWSAVKKIDDEGRVHFDAVVYDHKKLPRNREYFGWPVQKEIRMITTIRGLRRSCDAIMERHRVREHYGLRSQRRRVDNQREKT